jgi:predicted permease
MLEIAFAILPIFALIGLGYLIRSRGFLGEDFWRPAERLTYFVLFPVLIVETLARAELSGLRILPMAAATVSAILLMTLIALRLRRRLHLDGPGFTSLYQGVVRMNTYIGLAVAAGLWDRAGLTLAAIAVAIIVPTVNVLSVAALARFAPTTPPSAAQVVGRLARNPLILACLIGALLNLLGDGLPPVVAPTMDILGQAALPLGLMAVGAGLDFQVMRTTRRPVIAATALRLLAMPLIASFACWAFDVQGLTAAVVILFSATPTATSAYILARQLGGDAGMMAGITTLQTAMSVVTLPVVLSMVM